jgi:hypothetical protein
MKAGLKYALAQILVIFRIAFMAVGLPRVNNIDYIDDLVLFIKSKAAIAIHGFSSHCDG